ncbi:MAG TPA: DNA polymerase III subunit beta [Opitutales bacterium]|nr:DNA polymerase III subunit beta [Opitutales bacterium]
MKFKINRDHFSSGLQQVLNIVSPRPSMPILGNVLIEADGDQITLTTTSIDLGIRCSIKAQVLESGAVTLPARRLANVIREMPNTEVAINIDEDHWTRVSSGSSNFRIMGIGKEDFPEYPTFSKERTVAMPQEQLARMLRSVIYAQSTDEARYILNGVYFNFEDGKLSVVATDGRRLALTSKELEFPPEGAGSIIIPAKTAAEVLRLLDLGNNVSISFSDQQVAFDLETSEESGGMSGSVNLVSKIVEGNYPNYQQVIPKETHQRIKLERELFLQCIHRAALVSSDKDSSVRLNVTKNLLEITASSADFGDAHESMAISYEGPDIEVAFNPFFLMDPLKALTHDEIYFELKDSLSPGVFKSLESFICVIMPLRLDDSKKGQNPENS